MKKFIPFFGVALLLNACVSGLNDSSQANINPKPQAKNCPKATVVSLPAVKKNESFYDRFDFHIRNIVTDADTVRFQSLKQDFVFCRGDNSWTVQPGTLPKELQPPSNYAAFAQETVNPKFKNIDFQGKTYQYRVVREPKFSLGENGNISRANEPKPAQDKVVFELVNPDSKKTQQKTLYTLKDLQNAAVKAGYSAVGSQLGFPRITSAVIFDNRIWWSVAFEQGEGNNGIATIVSYDPQTDKFTLIQPEELWSTQITDLAITGDRKNPTLWMGTNVSGEGNLYIPAKGLVAYRPNSPNPNSGSLTAYTVDNSPLVGAIPDKLKLENEHLWVSTGNGVCQLKWQTIDNRDWSCWRFAAMAKLPSNGLPLYSALTNKTPAVSLSGNNSEDVEVLWWSPTNFQTLQGRYEVRYPQGFKVEVDEGGSIYEFKRSLSPGKPPVYWPGFQWHWNGDRFVRGLDEVSLNLVGGGPRGIGSGQISPDAPINWNTMRGDLELLQLSAKSTSVKYYSGWVDAAKLQPYLTVVPQERPQNPQTNPLAAKVNELPSRQ